MATFRIDLPENYEWEGVEFYDTSVWGNGNKGKNLWGFPNKKGASVTVSPPEKCQESQNNQWYIKVSVSNPSPKYGEGLSFIARCKLNDEENPYGVFSSNQLIPESIR